MAAQIDPAQTTSIGGYRITGILGEGGMGKVYVAEHELLGRRAAIKVLLPEFSNDQEVVNRFFKEAKASTAIRHPGIVKIYDFGYQEDGSAYIAMEYMEGEALDERLRRLGQLPIEQALRFAGQMASALAAAHHHGIVHRDLKPANVFIVADPQVSGGERIKLLDFGIAKFAVSDDPDAKQTRAGAILGSPQYMAPEQIRGSRDVDARADLYSVGCMMFEMACGRPPFDGGGNGAMAVMASHLDDPPPIPSTLRADLPREVDALILYLLAKDPAHRYQSAGDLGLAINAILGEQVSFASLPGITAEMSQIDRTAPSGVALSPAGVPLSDSQIISHATSQLGMQSPTTMSMAAAPGQSQMRTQAIQTSGKRSRVIAMLAAAVVILAAGGLFAFSRMGGKSQEVAVVDEAAPEPEKQPEPEVEEEDSDEPPKLTYKKTVVESSDGSGESEVVIVMSVAENQGPIDWAKNFSIDRLVSGAVFKDIISTIKLKVVPPRKVVWRIASKPKKVEVVDMAKGAVVGKTPLRIEFVENPDIQATYKLRAEGYDDQIIKLSGSDDYNETITLVPKVEITIKSKPEGAEVVDASGQSLGVTPATVLLSRSAQPISMNLKLEGYEDLAVQVVPDGNKKEKFELVKVRATFTHRIVTEPPGATVFNDKKEEVGVTPFEVQFLEDKGRIKYYVELDKYRKETVRLDADKNDEKSLKLHKCDERKRSSRNTIGPRVIQVYGGCD